MILILLTVLLFLSWLSFKIKNRYHFINGISLIWLRVHVFICICLQKPEVKHQISFSVILYIALRQDISLNWKLSNCLDQLVSKSQPPTPSLHSWLVQVCASIAGFYTWAGDWTWSLRLYSKHCTCWAIFPALLIVLLGLIEVLCSSGIYLVVSRVSSFYNLGIWKC